MLLFYEDGVLLPPTGMEDATGEFNPIFEKDIRSLTEALL